MAVAYLRVSTADQTLGPDAQRAAVVAWARGAGARVVAWCRDDAVSGGAALEARAGLGRALAAVRDHGAGVLVVARRDRLARDVGVALAIERAAAQAGARVASADGVGNGDDPADAFLRTVIDGAAQYERALIRTRTKAALAVKRARGERAGTVPFGFAADAAGRLVPAPCERAARAHARDLRAHGTKLWAIVAQLAAAGYRGRTGRPFGLTQVARMVAGVARGGAAGEIKNGSE